MPISFHPSPAFKPGKRRKEDLETNLDSLRGARAGKNKCSFLADITCSALTSFYEPAVQPPKYSQRLQGEPNGFSGVLLPVHPSPRAGLFELAPECYGHSPMPTRSLMS